MKRTILTLLAIVTLVASVAACTPRDVESYTCLDTGRPVYDVPPDHRTPFPDPEKLLVDGTTVDARGESFVDNTLDAGGWSQGMKYHARTGSRDSLCLVGGEIHTDFDSENTSWNTWHGITGLHVEVDNFTVVGTRIRNVGDAIAFVGASNWKVIGVRIDGGAAGGYVHDDCIENDNMATGSVTDSKLDGCNVFMSANSGGDGTGNEVVVDGSLVRLRPFLNSYNTVKYGQNNHGGFFKWSSPHNSGTPPHLVVKNTVFRADKQGLYGGNVNGFLGLPPGTECDNVMLVGTSAWRTTDLASWQSQCTNLTLGTAADWDARVAAWDAEHPEL